MCSTCSSCSAHLWLESDHGGIEIGYSKQQIEQMKQLESDHGGIESATLYIGCLSSKSLESDHGGIESCGKFARGISGFVVRIRSWWD